MYVQGVRIVISRQADGRIAFRAGDVLFVKDTGSDELNKHVAMEWITREKRKISPNV